MIIKGNAHWAKVIGPAQPTKFNPNGEWSIDVSIDEATQKELLRAGVNKDYFKDKGDDRGVFLTFKRNAKKNDGTPAKPFAIVDNKGKPWGDTKIGNGSVVNVKIALNEREFRGKKFLKPSALAIQVWELVEYEGGFPVADTDSAAPSSEEWN